MAKLTGALAKFAKAAPTIDAAKALDGTDASDLIGLVAALSDKQQLAHLEALGDAGLGKAVKKAARKAAYKLKSAGVSVEWVAPKAMDMSVDIDFDRVSMIGGPGIDGHEWIAVASLPGADGGEIDLKDPSGKVRIEPAEELAPSRLRNFVAELRQGGGQPRPIIADAALAVRMIDRVKERLEQGEEGLPKAFGHFDRWRDFVVGQGVDPLTWSARDKVKPATKKAATSALAAILDNPQAGFLAPPMDALATIEDEFGALLHSDETITRAAFEKALVALADRGADAWFKTEGVPATLTSRLEGTADVLFFQGKDDLAAALLKWADIVAAHDGDGSDLELLKKGFRGALDLEGAWTHRDAHMRGEAHH